MPFFNHIPPLPEDPIFGLPLAFAADPRPHKVNLGMGVYQTAEGLPLVFSSVKKAEHLLLQKNLNKDYLPIAGDGEFLQSALQLLLGNNSSLLQTGQFFAAQTVGGASALRIGGEFLTKLVSKTIFLPQPTWSNHKPIFEKAGFQVSSYPYFNPKTCRLDDQSMYEALRNMPPGSVVLLHGCCHNPTGIDPTFEQWQELSHLIKQQQLIPFFDMAYQGLGQDLEQDAQAIRYFVNEKHALLIAYSFSKNFGLYGERVGFLTVTSSYAETIAPIGSQIKSLIRADYSNPPVHGARIVSTILKSPELTLEWKTELSHLCERVQEMRRALMTQLLIQGQNRTFNELDQQKGLFSFLGLTPEQVALLRQEKALYMPSNGRINLAGLNTQNVFYVAKALLSVM